LVTLKVDAIVVQTTPAALAAKQATSTIPIIITSAIDRGWSGSGEQPGPAGRQCYRVGIATTRNQRESSVAA
jgi:hypothetical protein